MAILAYTIILKPRNGEGEGMAKSKQLRELTRKAPSTFEEIEQIVDALRDFPDLSAAITGVALVETSLERVLTSRLRTLTKEEQERLFGTRGPLGTFDAKIQIGYAIGVLTKPLTEELDTIRQIRNVFAHSRYPLTFEDAVLADAVLAMKMGAAVRSADLGSKLKLNNKQWFVLTIRGLLILLDSLQKDSRSAEEVLRSALEESKGVRTATISE